jgi:zinc protease
MLALYQKGHPHWLTSTLASIKEIPRLTRHDIKDFYTRTFSAVGAVICVVGDIRTEKYMESIRKSLQALPSKASLALPNLPVDLLQNASEVDCVCTLKNKMSIDTLIGIPLTLTREHHAFQALQVAISILGGSTSSRFFTKLRTEKSLTYGANAIMNGFGEGYPGYLFGLAIFPATVFLEGRNALKEIVKEFAEKGVTKIELEERKEEIAGRFKVGLSTTSGVCSLLVTTLLEGKSISYIDTYVDTISTLTLANVNEVIKEQVDFTLAKTASAGAVDQKGQPL